MNCMKQQFEKIKKYEVTVEIQSEENYQDTKIAVYTVCKTLQQVPGLTLHISFDESYGREIIKAMFPVLDPFSSLRVHEVQFGELIESRFRNRIKSMMEGDSSPDNLHERYREFLFFVDPCQSKEYSEKVTKAREAADQYDFSGFIRARDELSNLLLERMGRSSEHDLLSSVHKKRKVASSASA